jgi:DNA-binding CsgD family transcriptional regulator
VNPDGDAEAGSVAAPEGTAAPKGAALPKGAATPNGTFAPKGAALPKGAAAPKGAALPKGAAAPKGAVALEKGGQQDGGGEQSADALSANKQSWRVNPYYIFGFLGLTFYTAWLFLSYLGPSQLFDLTAAGEVLFNMSPLVVPDFLQLDQASVGTQLPMTAVAALALALGWRMSDFLSTNAGKNLLLTLAIITGPLPGLSPLAHLIGLGDWTFVAWLLSGFSYASLLLCWSTLLITFEDRHITYFIASVLIAGTVVYLLVASSIVLAMLAFTAIMPVFSAVCFILSLRSRRKYIGRERALIVVSSHESDEKDPINWRLIADTLTYTPCLGIGIYCALHQLSYPLNILCVGLATIVSSLLIIADTRWWQLLSSKMQLKLFLPLAAVCVFPLSFVDEFVGEIAVAIVVFLLFSAFMLSLVTNYSAISLCVRVFELSPIRVFAYGRAFNLAGVAFGYLFALVAFSSPLAYGQSHGTILAFCALMLLFIIASTFILEDHYPISSDVADDGSELDSQTPKRDLWDERCAQISKRYGLSPRQAEVLLLLSKGRNTVYVQEKLVISHYTAKAHIYNIYQKIGIHSRQELLDLIEQVELK